MLRCTDDACPASRGVDPGRLERARPVKSRRLNEAGIGYCVLHASPCKKVRCPNVDRACPVCALTC